jgi:hypothetical protein
VLLEGDAAGGKTAAVAFCANRTNSPLTRFNMTPNTTIADFVGQLGLSGDDTFSFCLGRARRHRRRCRCPAPPQLQLPLKRYRRSNAADAAAVRTPSLRMHTSF